MGTAGDGSPEQKNLGYEAHLDSHDMREYDIVVMASDGVWDNLYGKDIDACLKEQLPNKKSGWVTKK